MQIHLTHRARILYAVHAIALLAALAFASPASAVDDSWSATASDGDFNNIGNWDGGSVPDGEATFDTSTTTNLTITANNTVGALTINGGTYTFTNGNTFTIDGAGITVNGGSAAISNSGTFLILNSATLDTASVNN